MVGARERIVIASPYRSAEKRGVQRGIAPWRGTWRVSPHIYFSSPFLVGRGSGPMMLCSSRCRLPSSILDSSELSTKSEGMVKGVQPIATLPAAASYLSDAAAPAPGLAGCVPLQRLIGCVDLLHALLRQLTELRPQVSHLVGMVLLHQPPVRRRDLLLRCAGPDP